jgi:penicillin amidase
MKLTWRRVALGLGLVLLLAAAAATLHVRGKRPQRIGERELAGLTAPVEVRYDESGVPHIRAANSGDLYRALGWLHAQDRLFQMDMLRRVARGELAEVLGPELLPIDKLFRTLRLRERAQAQVPTLDGKAASTQAVQAYLDGVNAFVAKGPRPLESELAGLPRRPFLMEDVLAVVGYQAYSFATALRADPVFSQARQLGAPYLKVFEPAWEPGGVIHPAGTAPVKQAAAAGATTPGAGLLRLASVSDALRGQGLPMFEGSNAWAVSGAHTASGKPLLAGDPHIAFSNPAVWWEAHLQAPGFELYGHFQPLNPLALLGHNQRFGWSLTMFQNDDMDLIAEKTDAAHPGQALVDGRWQALTEREEQILVKGQAPVTLKLRQSPHGPIVNEALGRAAGEAPVALWWTFLVAPNPAIEAFWQLNRADTLAKARQAASLIHAPGLNVVWANADGDIGWWAAALLPERPAGNTGRFILDGSQPESAAPVFRPFATNPQSENPASGVLISANHQPASPVPVPGYYNLRDRAQRLADSLTVPGARWTTDNTRALQLDAGNGYAKRLLSPLMADLRAAAQGAEQRAMVDQLAAWDGSYAIESIAATVFHQFTYELARAAMRDELGDDLFALLLRTHEVDDALVALANDAQSPWWDVRGTPAVETRADTVATAWRATLGHLTTTLGSDSLRWAWGHAHTLTHNHPLGRAKPLDKLFNIGPFAQPGGPEVPNNLSGPLAPAPWAVAFGPSTRRIIDFAKPDRALGINPVGQSGVWGDEHWADQAARYARGEYRVEALSEADIAARSKGVLRLVPGG